MPEHLVIAIDGPAGAGKSTVAKRLAKRLGFLYIDTGAMYRAVAYWAQQTGTDFADMHRLEQLAIQAQIELTDNGTRVWLNGVDITESIRTQEMSDGASKVSAIRGVRRALVEKQRAMAASASVVMEGRDIGTNVFPDAPIKIFLDASVAVRSRRRLKDIEANGTSSTLNQVAREIEERDQRDRTRADAPLLQAPDAEYLDTSGLSIEEVEEEILKIYRRRTANGKERKS